MAKKCFIRRGTHAEWLQANPVIRMDEMVFVKDTWVLKIGNGVSRFNDLPGVSIEALKIPESGIPIIIGS